MTPFQRWLDALPTTNLKLVVFVALTIATFLLDVAAIAFLLVWAAQHPGKELRVAPLVEYLHDGWLLYLGAFGGISLGQFAVKRKTYAAPSPDSERAQVPAEPPPATPSPS